MVGSEKAIAGLRGEVRLSLVGGLVYFVVSFEGVDGDGVDGVDDAGAWRSLFTMILSSDR